MNAHELLELERTGDTLILAPTRNLRELETREMEAAAERVTKTLRDATIRNVIVDLSATDYFGSSAVSLFLRAWKTVRNRGGCLVLCGVSPHETEILDVCGLHIWPICDSRSQALALIRDKATASAGKLGAQLRA